MYVDIFVHMYIYVKLGRSLYLPGHTVVTRCNSYYTIATGYILWA